MNGYKNKKNIAGLRTSKIVCIILSILVLFLFAYPANANLLDDKIKELQELSRQSQEFEQKVDEKKQEINTLSSQIEAMDNQLAQTQAEIEQAKLQIEKNELEIEDVSNKIAEKEKEIEIQKEILLECILIMYEQDKTSTLEIIASSDTFSSFLAQVEYIESIEDQIQDTLSKIEKLKKELEVQKTQLEDKKRELTLLKEEKELKEKSLSIQIAAKDDLLAQTRGDESAYQQKLEEAKAKHAQVFSELIRLEEQSGRGGGRNTAPRDGRYFGYFVWPLDSYVVTQGYGMTEYAKWGAYGGKGHNGIDIASYHGAPVKAAASGTAVCGSHNAWGNWVAVYHPNGLTTLYAHLNSSATGGGYVEQGQVIGYQGNTGASTGSHLHFSVYFDFWIWGNCPAYNYEGTLNPFGVLP